MVRKLRELAPFFAPLPPHQFFYGGAKSGASAQHWILHLPFLIAKNVHKK